jgi:hypothetical protein
MSNKNAAAVALGKRRAAGLTPEHQAAAAQAKADAMSPKQRKALMAKAGAALKKKRAAAKRKGKG